MTVKEVPLIENQFMRKQSIFACDDYAVISSMKMSIGKDECGWDLWTWVNDLPEVPMGQLGLKGVATKSYLNTETFIWAWTTLMNSGYLWRADFAVKADPDCVFFPDRLRTHLKPSLGTKSYFLNCNYNGEAKIFGALEVYSVPAMKVYQAKSDVCKGMDWHGWGEDLYMQECMRILGATAVEDMAMVGDDRCLPVTCTDPSRASYHPYKDLDDYQRCWTQSVNSEMWR